jgi:putative addiction module killer protein
LRELRDANAVARVLARIGRIRRGNLGDCKPVGEGVSELRVDYGPGYRIYFGQRGCPLEASGHKVQGRRRQIVERKHNL